MSATLIVESTPQLPPALLQTPVAPDLQRRFNVHDVESDQSLQSSEDHGRFAARVLSKDLRHLVAMSGDLESVSREAAIRACTLPAHIHAIVDISNVSFMDCSGYSALVAAQAILQRRGGSLTLTGAAGEPFRLLSLVEQELGNEAMFLKERPPTAILG